MDFIPFIFMNMIFFMLTRGQFSRPFSYNLLSGAFFQVSFIGFGEITDSLSLTLFLYKVDLILTFQLFLISVSLICSFGVMEFGC